MKTGLKFRIILFLGLVFGAGLQMASFSKEGASSVATILGETSRRQAPGASVTLLSDGRRLILGGEGRETAPAQLLDAGGVAEIASRGLSHPRAWHTATVLPDGQVLIAGGIDAQGKPVRALEVYDPASREFRDLEALSMEARSHASATLLTDGSLLIAGGVDAAGKVLDSVWILDPAAGSARDAGTGLHSPRKDAGATLQADGSVLLTGGQDNNGRRVGFAERFDPARLELTIEPEGLAADSGNPRVAFSSPADGEAGVSPAARIALRFSEPLRVETVGTGSVVLEGPQGRHGARVVSAEEGRLVFVTPEGGLRPDAAYRLSLSGIITRSGASLPDRTLAFTTRSADEDGESWVPGPGNGNGNWTSGRPPSPWQSMKPLQGPEGVTALAGQVLTLDGKPLAGVTFEIEGQTATSDHTGRFLVTSAPAGHQELVIDGGSASDARRSYGLFEAGIELTEGKTNILPYTIWMPRLDTAHKVAIPSPTSTEVVVTTPLIPGLEVHIPPNTVIVDRQGNPVREVGITPIPVDRTPFPLPGGVYVPIYYTIQPGGAYVQSGGYWGSPGVRLIYPNYRHESPGTRLDFWSYDPEEKGWWVYGKGTVTPDARQVVPDPGLAIYEFTGAMISGGGSPPTKGPPPGNNGKDGEPVDLSTGLFVSEFTDLYEPDIIPIEIRRVYRPGDSTSRAFGIGTNHPYGMFLWSQNNYQDADLVLPDGGRIHYIRISPGTGFTDAIYESTTTPGEFYKSRIAWNGNGGWDVTLKSGLVYVFGDMAPLQAIRDRSGNKLTITRSSGTQGNITRVTSPSSRYVDFTYDLSDRVTQVKDQLGRTVNYVYDASGRLSTVTNSASGVTTYTYDTSNRILTIKDPRNTISLTNQYDVNGRIFKQTLANAGIYQFAYTLDVAGNVTQTDVTDPRGFVRRVTFTPVGAGSTTGGYVLTDTYALGKPEQQTYTYEREMGTNLILSITDPLGRRTAYAYDGMGNVSGVTRLAGTGGAVTTTIVNDQTLNVPLTVTDPLNHTTTFTYDTAGKMLTVANALGHTTTFTYNAAGQPLTAARPGMPPTQFSFDFGDFSAITDPLGRTGLRFVDGAGRTIRVSDPVGRWRQYEYDAVNRLTKSTDQQSGATSLTYDPNGNLLTLTDPRAKVNTFTYDTMNFQATRKDPLNRTESFIYDALGNLTKYTDRRGKVTTYTYDPLSRRKFVGFGTTVKGQNTTYDSTITYTYDAANRLVTAVDSISGTNTFGYDNLDRLTSETSPQGTVTYTYDAANRRRTMTVAGQPQVVYDYDNADRLIQVTQGTSVVGIAYDASDHRSVVTLPNGVTMTYTYDSATQVTDITYRLGATVLGNLGYEYDVSGRRSRVTGTFARTLLPAALSSAIYDSANEMTKRGNTNMTYDANGNLTNDGTNTYTWDARNQLASVSGGVTASFKYDAFRRRIERTVTGTTTKFLYDLFNPIQEITGGSPSANLLAGLGTDEYFVRTDAAGARSFLRDSLGSMIALTDAAGALQTQYTYEPFGKVTASGPTSTNSFQFTGRENDGTGLYAYRARYYSPLLQRFASEDPVELSGDDINFYAYVFQNPVNEIDPFGLWTFQIGIGVSGFLPIRGPGGLQFSGYAGFAYDGNQWGTYWGGGGGPGVGSPGAAGGITIGGSNAKNICGLRGLFVNAGGSGGAGWGGGAEGFRGKDSEGNWVTGGNVMGGVSTPGGSGGVIPTWTWVHPFGSK